MEMERLLVGLPSEVITFSTQRTVAPTIAALAAAYAEDEDFENAVKHQQQVIAMTKPADKLRAEGQRRLELY